MEQTASHGCASAHHAEKPTEILSDEHRVIERVLGALEVMTKSPVKGSLERWRMALDFIRHFADQCHHFKEEKLLFPSLEEHGIPRDGGPIGMMLMEHEEGRALVRAMFTAVERIAASDAAAEAALCESAEQYVRLLREHIQKEDDVLFRMADEVIPPDEQRQLLKDFETHEAKEMGAGAHEKYLTIAQNYRERRVNGAAPRPRQEIGRQAQLRLADTRSGGPNRRAPRIGVFLPG